MIFNYVRCKDEEREVSLKAERTKKQISIMLVLHDYLERLMDEHVIDSIFPRVIWEKRLTI